MHEPVDLEPPSDLERRSQRAMLICLPTGWTFSVAGVLDHNTLYFEVAWVFYAICLSASGLSLWLGHLRHKRIMARIDERSSRGLVKVRESMAAAGFELPAEVSADDLLNALIYVGMGKPIYAPVDRQWARVHIVARAAVATRHVIARSGRAPRRWQQREIT